jgi:hypothetical protein
MKRLFHRRDTSFASFARIKISGFIQLHVSLVPLAASHQTNRKHETMSLEKLDDQEAGCTHL